MNFSIFLSETHACSLRDKGSHVADAGHQADNHGPRQVGAMERGWLVDDRSKAFGLHDRPDEESDASGGCDNRLEGKKVAAEHRLAGEHGCKQRYAHIL